MPQNDEVYDVIIVGGGPAGSTVGYLLGQAGLHVAIFDKATFPRDKLCGGFVTEKALRLIERIFGLTNDSLKKNQIFDFEAFSYNLWFKTQLIATDTFEIPFRFVRRSAFDAFLLNLAKSKGVCINEGSPILQCDPEKGLVTTASGRVLKANYIIGADGANSVVRKSFPKDIYSEEQWKANLATGIEIAISRTKFFPHLDRANIYFGFIKHGYSWMFPRANDIAIGMGGLNRANAGTFKTSFLRFLSAIKVPDPTSIRIHAHPIPYGNYLKSPGFGRTFLIGDAAGYADSLLGEGIFYAILSAELVAETIISNIKPP
jgi:menaquinone-9 beta-reductase